MLEKRFAQVQDLKVMDLIIYLFNSRKGNKNFVSHKV